MTQEGNSIIPSDQEHDAHHASKVRSGVLQYGYATIHYHAHPDGKYDVIDIIWPRTMNHVEIIDLFMESGFDDLKTLIDESRDEESEIPV